jgi:hypothetical protein
MSKILNRKIGNKLKKGRKKKQKKKEKNEGFPRPGGDFVAPGKN